jgi:hypothetical protein
MNLYKFKFYAVSTGTLIYLALSAICAVNVSEGKYGLATFVFMGSLHLLLNMLFFFYHDFQK